MATLIAVLVFAFALTAFADDIIVSKTESDEYGTIIQLNQDPGLENAKNYVSTLKKINDAGTDTTALCILTDGAETPSYYVFPSSYVVWEWAEGAKEVGRFELYAGTTDQAGLVQALNEFNTAMDTSYYTGYTIASSGGNKRLEAVVRFEFPTDVTYAHADYCCMRSYPKLVEVKINHSIDFSKAEKMFYSNSKLATVTGFENVDGTKLAKTMFASCSALRYIKLPANTTKIPSSFFQGAKGVNVVNMAELTQLTTISSWAFDGTKYLTITLPDSVTTIETSAFENAFSEGGSLTISPNSQLTTIGNVAFRYSSKLTSFYMPSTVTSIGERAFENSGIKTIENFENCQITKLNNKVFNAAAIETIKIPVTVTEINTAFMSNSNLKLVYIPKSVTLVADTFTSPAANVVFLYTGNDASIFADCATLAGANVIQASNYDSTVSYSGINLVVGYSSCVAYNNGNHGETSKTIEVTSYTDVIKVHQMCLDCQNALETDEIAPLFTCLGYSTAEFANGGISVGYNVNKDAISEYETISGVEVSYGLFAGTKQGLGTNDVIGEDGKAVAGAITAGFENSKYSFMFIKMFGFNEDNKDTPFAIGAYVAVDNGEGKEYSYLQNEKPQNGAKYSFVSYNSVANANA